MKSKCILCLWAQLLLLFFASDNFAQLYSLETKNLRLIYLTKAHEYVVPHLARCFENALRFHRNLFDYTPTEKVTLLLEDFGDYGHGAARPFPKNFMRVGIAPFFYVYEAFPANERMNWLMNHESTHIVASDKSSKTDNFFRSLFGGKVYATTENPISMIYGYLTNPRWYSPRWFHEGIAVFMETWMAGGLGRVLGAYDEMVFRTMVRDSSYIYDMVGLESEGTTIDFRVGANSYLYGTRFISYLANKYGPEKLIKWISRTNDSKAYFASQFKRLYGASLDDEWSRWIESEHEWQRANLDSIRKYPTTPYRPLTRRTLGHVSRAYYDSKTRKIYSAVRYPGQIAHIAAIDIETGKIKKIHDIKGAAQYYVTSLAYDPSSATLFYTTDNNKWRDLNALSIKTGKSRRLIKDVRTGDLAFNQADKSIWGVRHLNGISTLVRIPHPYKEWEQIYSFPYGKDIFDIDVSPDGSTVTAALAEADGSQRLIKMDVEKLLKGDNSYEVFFDFELSTPANFVFSSDGKYLFGSSYYSGISNIYRYDLEVEDMNIVSNCETGFFRPIPISNDSLIVFRYTEKGFVPVMIPSQSPEYVSAINFLGNEIANKYPIVRSWTQSSPTLINIDSLTTFSGRYSTLGNMSLVSAFPIVEGFKDFVAIGMSANFLDPLGLSGFDVTTSYSPDGDLPSDERVHLKFNFHHWDWKISATYNGADFYDLFGPTKRSRKGYSLGLKFKKNLLFDEPKSLDFNIRVTGYGNLERLPDFQNVETKIGDIIFDKLLSVRTSLNYQFIRKSLGAVDDEKGIRCQLEASSNYVNSEIYPRAHFDFDYGILLPINHSSIWLRTSAGYSFGDRDNPFVNFFFGGFGNNWVDYLTEKRYREYYSFPGVEINDFGGKNYGKVMLEWNLPPIRFRRFGFPALYFNWTRIALFTSGIRTNFDSKGGIKPLSQFGVRRTLINVGGQVDFRLVLFSHLESTFSLGYAAAFEENQPLEKEFMISLKILK
ncbi:MAG: hypothetical protein ACE5JB_04565 [bacterium]